jgi:hypothetical protein
MEVTSTSSTERRCPTCGALVIEDAQWCPQCFSPLPKTEPEPPPPPPTLEEPDEEIEAGSAEVGATDPPSAPAQQKKALTWPCAACLHENPIDLDTCELCGTSFATLMRADEKPPEVEPTAALRRSLIFPGLGHALVGRPLDGLARGALFAMLLVMLLIVLLSGLSSTVAVVVFLLFLAMALVAYAGAAWEAYRLADGDPPFVSSRTLLWVTAGVILGSSALLAFTLAIVAKR